MRRILIGMAAWMLASFSGMTFAACLWCPSAGVCEIRDGAGFLYCSYGACSGNCSAPSPTPSPMPTPSPHWPSDIPGGWGGGGGGGGGGGCLINCNGGLDPDWPDDGWWDLVKTLPDATPSKKVQYSAATCYDCAPEQLGPILQEALPHTRLAQAQGNWLLALAIKNIEQGAARGIHSVGSVWFAMPENQKQKQTLLDGGELAAPVNASHGFSGLTTYNTVVGSGGKGEGRYIDIELKAWRVSMQKGAPTHGVSALLRYEKNRDDVWTLVSVQADSTMPQPNLAYFPNLEKNIKLFAKYNLAN